jgi:hypothetical protein
MALLKKIVLVVGPLVFIGMLLYVTMGSGPKIPGGMNLVDIRTGEIRRFDRDTVTSLPWKSPKDGERVLLPAQKNEEGTWYVSSRYHPTVVRWQREHGETAVDLESDGLIRNPVGP